MSKASQSTPPRRRETEVGPAEVGDAVEVERINGDTQPGIVRDVELFHDYDAPDRLVVEVSDDPPEVNVSRDQVEVVTGADADLVKSILGDDDDA